MPSPAILAYWEGVLLLVGMVGVVAWKLASGEYALDELFEGPVREADGTYTTQTSAGRVQIFWVTIIVAGSYLLRVINEHSHQFPDVSDGMLALLAGSHALYLGGKAQGMLLGRFRDILGRTS